MQNLFFDSKKHSEEYWSAQLAVVRKFTISLGCPAISLGWPAISLGWPAISTSARWSVECCCVLLIVHHVRFAVFFSFSEFIFVAFYSLKFVGCNLQCTYAALWDGYMRYVNEASSSISSSCSAHTSLAIDKRWTRFLFEWRSHKMCGAHFENAVLKMHAVL